ncbi:MAG: nitroreductase family protein [Candidatus Bipolaricaulota bacterium]
MDFFELIDRRISVRSYNERPVSEEKIDKLLRAANSAPSAGNLQAYSIHVVTSQEKRNELLNAAYNQHFIAEAPLVVVFLQDAERSARKYGERGEELFSIQDATIAAAYLQLAATELSLDTCWVGAFNEEAVQRVLDLEKRPISIITVGYSTTKPQDRGRRDLEDLVTFEESS